METLKKIPSKNETDDDTVVIENANVWRCLIIYSRQFILSPPPPLCNAHSYVVCYAFDLSLCEQYSLAWYEHNALSILSYWREVEVVPSTVDPTPLIWTLTNPNTHFNDIHGYFLRCIKIQQHSIQTVCIH